MLYSSSTDGVPWYQYTKLLFHFIIDESNKFEYASSSNLYYSTFHGDDYYYYLFISKIHLKTKL